MHTVTRPDGSTYLVSSRVAYCAIGWVPPAHRGEVLAILNAIVTALAAGFSPEDSVQTLVEPARSVAIGAVSLVREFESVIGQPSAPVVEEGVRTADHADNIGVFSGGPYQCEGAADLGDRAARALAELLTRLGALDVVCANVD
jgi:hypothetical protein